MSVLALGLVLSLAIGMSLGVLGGGGSILTVPVLHYVLGLEAHAAIATSLVVVGITSAVAMVPHARAGRVSWRLGLTFGAASMATAFVGARLGGALPGAVLVAAFALVMLAAGIAMLARARAPARSYATSAATSVPRVLAIGLGVGLVTGALGAGGGFLIVPALVLLGGLDMRKAVGTSLLVIALNSAAGVSGAATHADLDGGITTAVTALAIAGSLVGARVARRVPAHHLQRAFGWFVIALGAVVLTAELA